MGEETCSFEIKAVSTHWAWGTKTGKKMGRLFPPIFSNGCMRFHFKRRAFYFFEEDSTISFSFSLTPTSITKINPTQSFLPQIISPAIIPLTHHLHLLFNNPSNSITIKATLNPYMIFFAFFFIRKDTATFFQIC